MSDHTPDINDLQVKIFADGADLDDIQSLAGDSTIKGFTTNPTLMRKANVQDYLSFAESLLEIVTDRPVSFEVFSDEFSEMEQQALELASWGKNVFVKIPVSNTKHEFSGPLIRSLSSQGVQVNVTALMTAQQVEDVAKNLSLETASMVSVFAGRIADTGRDPMPIMRRSVEILSTHPKTELIWASPRELLNIFQADAVGCHIITATNDVLSKLKGIGKNLDTFSLETVQMFRKDAVEAGYKIVTSIAR